MTVRRSDSEREAAVDAALAAWLGSGQPGEDALSVDRALLLHRININGVGPLLALKSDLASLPGDLAQFLRESLIAREMWEEQHRRVVAQGLDALRGAGLGPLLMKGTALAYTHYDRPAARVRGDTDILVDEHHRAQAFAALEKAGFSRELAAGGTSLGAEATFRLRDRMGEWHDIDLHWRLNSSPVLARVFSHRELVARARTIPSLHAAARCPGRVDALLYSAVHRRKHIDRPTEIHVNGVPYPVIDSLTWLMDIHLLFGSLERTEHEHLLERAREKGICDILRDALADASRRLGTTVPDDVAAALAPAGRGSVARYIAAAPTKALLLDLAATKGTPARASTLRELFFPPRDYMRARFARGRGDWLPVLHMRRILPGVAKHLSRKRKSS